jgi:hypothetical protein
MKERVEMYDNIVERFNLDAFKQTSTIDKTMSNPPMR